MFASWPSTEGRLELGWHGSELQARSRRRSAAVLAKGTGQGGVPEESRGGRMEKWMGGLPTALESAALLADGAEMRRRIASARGGLRERGERRVKRGSWVFL
jgi:hypothetical protein